MRVCAGINLTQKGSTCESAAALHLRGIGAADPLDTIKQTAEQDIRIRARQLRVGHSFEMSAPPLFEVGVQHIAVDNRRSFERISIRHYHLKFLIREDTFFVE